MFWCIVSVHCVVCSEVTFESVDDTEILLGESASREFCGVLAGLRHTSLLTSHYGFHAGCGEKMDGLKDGWMSEEMAK